MKTIKILKLKVPRTAGSWLARCLLALAASMFALSAAQAQDTVCASVKIQIKQELTLERQAFDAEMRINNTTDSSLIENVTVVVKVTEDKDRY